MIKKACTLFTIVAALIVAPQSLAQTWPAKPVRIIVPFAPGGNTDSIARITAEWLTQRIGGTFIVENKPGANGAIAAGFVATSTPDGYTLFMATLPQMAILPAMTKTRYDPVKDFALISIVASNDFALAVNDIIPAKTLKEFVAYVKERPGKLAYASGGSGSVGHLVMALLLQRAELQMDHIGYKGGAPALADVLAGHVSTYFGNLAEIIPHARGGKIQVLAVSGDKRVPQLSDVPTVAEQGYRGFSINTWNALVAPAGSPNTVVDRISREISAATKDPGFLRKLESIGVEAIGNSPAEFAKVLEADMKTWAEAVRISGAKIE